MNVDPDKIQAMISILQSMLETPESSSTTVVEEDQNPEKFTQIKPSIKNTNTWNKFDKMMEKHMHKEDIAIDKQLSVHPPVPRTRVYEPISVKCRVCGKTENINPQVATSAEIDRYKCNRCSISPG
jgi:hypothetical protein